MIVTFQGFREPNSSPFSLLFFLQVVSNLRIVQKLPSEQNFISLLRITSWGLLKKSLKVLGIPRMMQGLSFCSLKFIVTRSDYPRYDVGSLPIGSQFPMCGVFPC